MVITPHFVSANEAERQYGHAFICPFCQAQSTSEPSDIGWVSMPELHTGPNWICLGCWIDVSEIAQRSEPTLDPYYEDLVRYAKQCDILIADMLQIFRRRQIKILREKPAKNLEAGAGELRHRLEEMVAGVH